MDWQTRMNRGLDYIEENLAGEIKLDVAAKIVGFSLWELQRMFSFVAYTSIGEYIRGRRLTLAAADIQAGKGKIIDIALKYGYDSHAAFSRAFSRQFGISPSQARSDGVRLEPYPKITFQTNIKEGNDFMKAKNDMQAYSERGYYVKENAPIYTTPDLEKTVAWFCDVLGWYGDIVAESGGGYGCVYDFPGEMMVAELAFFRGFHLFKGEPSKGVVGFIRVQGLEKFRQYVLANGWDKISEIESQPWGANECRVTTVDGSVLRFFEVLAV